MNEAELLRKRLDREKRARREAEHLLETKSAELFRAKEQLQKQYDALLRRNAKIELLDSIVKFAQQSQAFRETMQRFLDVVCSTSGWPVGHVYVTHAADPDRLRPLKVWHLADPAMFESFRAVTERTEFSRGEGLPGRVLASGAPAWIDDVHTDPNFPRAQACGEIKVRSAFGVPIKVYGAIVAVAEFYTAESSEKDPWLLETVATTAEQLGSLLERQEAEHTLERVNAELRERNQEMQQFAYTVSHDLKTPLVTVNGFAGMLREDMEAGRTEDAWACLGRITAATDKMGRLISDLLELSRIGRVCSDAVEVDTSAMVREVTEGLAAQLHEKDARVVVQPDMPRVRVDPTRLAQAFENLLTNAIKYGCERPGARIQVGAQFNGKEVRFFVRDSGPGIPPQFHEKIFGLFQRLHNDNRGTGVGLAIVAKIMQLYAGRCCVESQAGEGATFWLAFPASALAAGTDGSPCSLSQAAG